MGSAMQRAAVVLPGSFGLQLVEAVEPCGFGLADLWPGRGDADLAAPDFEIPLGAGIEMIERARRLTGEPALGVQLGLRARAAAHGYVGLAAMTAPTLGDALCVAIRYAPTLTNALSVRFAVDGGAARVTLVERAAFGPARDAVVLACMVGLWRLGCDLTGRSLDVSLRLAIPRPGYFDRTAAVLPPIAFGEDANELRARDLSVLRLPVRTADPAAHRLVERMCVEALERTSRRRRPATRVRDLIAEERQGSISEAASAMHVSARTLRRRLADDGVSFSQLVDDQRREKALLLMRTKGASVKDVAAEVGYAHASNFVRAFRRWTGKTPSAYRSRPERARAAR